MPNVADNIIATLKASGVQRIYGLPGDSLNGFTDALRRDGDLEWTHVRHEEAAAFAAGAEAAITGQLAVVAAELWAGQSPPDQRAVRRQPEPCARPGHCRPHPERGDRWWLFPRNPSPGALPRVQRLLRAGQRARPVSLGPGNRYALGPRAPWCCRGRHTRRDLLEREPGRMDDATSAQDRVGHPAR